MKHNRKIFITTGLLAATPKISFASKFASIDGDVVTMLFWIAIFGIIGLIIAIWLGIKFLIYLKKASVRQRWVALSPFILVALVGVTIVTAEYIKVLRYQRLYATASQAFAQLQPGQLGDFLEQYRAPFQALGRVYSLGGLFLYSERAHLRENLSYRPEDIAALQSFMHKYTNEGQQYSLKSSLAREKNVLMLEQIQQQSLATALANWPQEPLAIIQTITDRKLLRGFNAADRQTYRDLIRQLLADESLWPQILPMAVQAQLDSQDAGLFSELRTWCADIAPSQLHGLCIITAIARAEDLYSPPRYYQFNAEDLSVIEHASQQLLAGQGTPAWPAQYQLGKYSRLYSDALQRILRWVADEQARQSMQSSL